jgi:uncharacterized protein YndB with AHSA1/START domain
MTIRKSVTVRCPPEQAFRVFTRDIGRWWPLQQGFSHGGERKEAIVLDDHAGGRFYERFTDGTELEIGRVTRAEPPHLILFTWQSPGWEAATEVEVRFTAAAEGTRVDLEHRGFEATEPLRERGRGFERGWDTVLAHFATAAKPESRSNRHGRA